MTNVFSRRDALRRGLAVPIASTLVAPVVRSMSAQTATQVETLPVALPIALPIRWNDGAGGDGFVIRHGFACENTIVQPGLYHTAEDWYAKDGAETAGAEIVAVAAGEVVFASYDYPGRVVIVQHNDALYSQYGHLDYDLEVTVGDRVEPGQRLGVVYRMVDRPVPSHLHFEMRTFLYTDLVNGDDPQYGFSCGFQCAPGPGYWPIDAPEHPAQLGWRNPTHQLAQMLKNAGIPESATVVVSEDGDGQQVGIWSEPTGASERIAQRTLETGERFALRDVVAGDPASTGSSARAYDLWFRIEPADEVSGWVKAITTSREDMDSDGRPTGVRFRLLPAI